MPFKCCVPHCRGNYDADTKGHIFGFPKEENLRNQWIRAIPRKDYSFNKNSKVCHKHFKPDDIEWESSVWDEKAGTSISFRLQRPKLKKNAVPSIFLGCPSYLTSSQQSTRESPGKKRQRLEQDAVAATVAKSVTCHEEYVAERSFKNLNELFVISDKFPCSSFWDTVVKPKCLIFLNVVICENVPKVFFAISIDEELLLRISYKEQPVRKLDNFGEFPVKVTNINEIHSVLDCIENLQINPQMEKAKLVIFDAVKSLLFLLKDTDNEQNKLVLQFVEQQICLLSSKPENYQYSPDVLIFASLLFLMSPQAYKFIRHSGYIILPHPSTIRKLNSKICSNPQDDMDNPNFLAYAKQKFSCLEKHELFVTLMLDEIHIKQFLDYKGGNIIGMSHDTQELASSAFVFMLQSFLSSYKDVVYILPAKKMTADVLFCILKKLILGLEKIGFKVIVVVTDNNSINRKTLSYFCSPPQVSICYPHPADPKRPLFYAVDSVHLIKCVRNNWINQKNGEQAMYYPNFDLSLGSTCTASFHTVKNLYEKECGNLLKFGYTLSRKALWPTNLERQNVKLALQVFNSHISQSLVDIGEQQHFLNFNDTADYIKIFTSWFNIMNVKTPYKGIHSRNDMCKPLISIEKSDQQFTFLENFLNWLDKWEKMDADTGKLTKETHLALKLTTHCMIELTKYCTEELHMSYLLPGKIQTDELESRFGLYRRLAGTQYHVSIRQVFEIENKLRVSSIMRLTLSSNTMGAIPVDMFVTDDGFDTNFSDFSSFNDLTVTDDDINKVESQLPIITYLAGYCAHSVLKKMCCNSCCDNLVIDKPMPTESQFKLIHSYDRGGLSYPAISVVNIVAHNYIIVQKLVSSVYETEFLKIANQRCVAYTLTMNILDRKEMCILTCENGHSSNTIMSSLIRSSTNTLLNNYCKGKNDALHKTVKKKDTTAKTSANRKLKTLS